MKHLPFVLVSAVLGTGLASAQVPSVQPPLLPKQTSLDDPKIGSDRVYASPTSLTFATHAPGDTDRLFIVEKRGRILILNLNTGNVNAVPFLDIDSRVLTGSEQGLLGLAFH